MLLLKLKRSVFVVFQSRRHGIVRHWWWRFGLGKFGGHSRLTGPIRVVSLTVHVVVFCNAPLTCLAADQCPSHSACYDSACNDDDGGCQHDPSSPSHVWDEEQNVDEEGQQRDQKRGKGKDEECKQITRRVGGRVEVSSDGESEAYQRHEGGNGVHNEDR